MVYGCTQAPVSSDGEYSGKIFDTDLSIVVGNVDTMALTRSQDMCRRYMLLGVQCFQYVGNDHAMLPRLL